MDDPVLHDEYERRKSNGVIKVKKTVTQTVQQVYKPASGGRGNPPTFRKYENHAHDFNYDYEKYMMPQGRLTNGKLGYGLRSMKLMRSSKYGNTCRDCAAVLELAPGLYFRNYGSHKGLKKGGDRLSLQKAANKLDITSSWWTLMLGTSFTNFMGKSPKKTDLFNPDDLHGQKNPKYTKRDNKTFGGVVGGFPPLKQWIDTMEIYSKFIDQLNTFPLKASTKYRNTPEINIQKACNIKSWVRKKDNKGCGVGEKDREDHELNAEAVRDLRKILETLDENRKLTDETEKKTKLVDTLGDINSENPAFRDMIYELERKYLHLHRFKSRAKNKVFDSDMIRMETRNKREHDIDSDTWYENCLVTTLYNPRGPAYAPQRPPNTNDVEKKIYYATIKSEEIGDDGLPTTGDVESERPSDNKSMWTGDRYVTEFDKKTEKSKQVDPRKKRKKAENTQHRVMKQSRLFITYSLHRAITSELEGRHIMEKMADAAYELFGNDVYLAELLVFGYKLKIEGSDTLSKARFTIIQKPNKEDNDLFYADANGSSYVYDTYETHVESVELDGGIEIGPKRHHPHFHILLTVNHWSYIQLDYFKMNSYLEMMFKGTSERWGNQYVLYDASGNHFYTDNENPYVKIKLYPQDNWEDVLSAYVRKSSVPGPMEAIGARHEANRTS